MQFFVRLPNGKVDANRKIPNLSKIQGKLARLNEAISEGLANERRQQLEARLRNSQESKVSEKNRKSLCHQAKKAKPEVELYHLAGEGFVSSSSSGSCGGQELPHDAEEQLPGDVEEEDERAGKPF